MEPLRRLFRQMTDGLLPPFAAAESTAAGEAAGEKAGGNPLSRINRVVQDIQASVEQQLAAARRVDEQLGEIETHVSRAWRERELVIQDYYATLRGLLGVWDDCAALAADHPGLSTVRAGLERTLREQGVELLPVSPGDRFDAETACCEQTEESTAEPPGVVLRVLETGYCRRLTGGMGVVIRPARVVVSRGRGEAEEPQLEREQSNADRY
jgi:molecular chaperone GrpE (heat shock protein)